MVEATTGPSGQVLSLKETGRQCDFLFLLYVGDANVNHMNATLIVAKYGARGYPLPVSGQAIYRRAQAVSNRYKERRKERRPRSADHEGRSPRSGLLISSWDRVWSKVLLPPSFLSVSFLWLFICLFICVSKHDERHVEALAHQSSTGQAQILGWNVDPS